MHLIFQEPLTAGFDELVEIEITVLIKKGKKERMIKLQAQNFALGTELLPNKQSHKMILTAENCRIIEMKE